MTTDNPRITEQGVATLPEQAWERARRRAEIIGPLVQSETVGHAAADAAAQALGLSRRQVYALIRRAWQGAGLVTDFAAGQLSGGKGKGRLPEPVERIIRELLQKRFLTKQKRSLAAFHREVAQICKAKNLRVPARKTVALRISSLDPLKTVRRREGQDASRELQGAGGVPPTVSTPLEQAQIDHTVIDLIVVDERDRQPIGRPYLTLAIDVFTRCVLGMVVTLEAPSAVSVGLCLAHVACDKRLWQEGLDVEMDWPMSGKPRQLYLDNAAEFKSEALRRGCEQHGIRLDYRPPGQPHYDGIVERIIGTAMQMIHDDLPGTTFSNPGQRGEYDADKMAALTLRELERWLTLAVGTYHGSVHNGLLQPPAARWAEAVARIGVPPVVTRPTAFLVDFLPVIRRTLTRIGHVYVKARYVEYLDDRFTQRKERAPEWRHLGLLGPAIRAEVGDTVKIVLKNNTDLPVSRHAQGLRYDKASEGAPYEDGTAEIHRHEDVVAPGATQTYLWDVPERAGPGASDPSSVVWRYHSHVDETADANTGLVGPIIVARQREMLPDGRVKGIDREFVVLFSVIDENASHYFDKNGRRFAPEAAAEDEPFRESNRMHAMNGYLYGHTAGPGNESGRTRALVRSRPGR